MEDDRIAISPKDVEVIDASEHRLDVSQHFGQVPEVAKSLLKEAKKAFAKIATVAGCTAIAVVTGGKINFKK